MSQTRSVARSLLVGAIASLGSWLILMFLERSDDAYSVAAFLFVAAWWFIVSAAAYLGDMRGLGVLWLLLLALGAVQVWNAYPLDAFIDRAEHPLLVRGLGMTNGFWAWSLLALPLFLATWLRLFLEGPTSRRLSWVVGVWLVLLWLARPLAVVAWDVGPPRYPPSLVAAFGLLILAPAPLALSGYLARQLWRPAGVVAPGQ